jgi:hypothetical protein
VGHLLMDLIERKPKDLAHAIGTFANRMSMLRECGFPMAEFLVALIIAAEIARTQSPPEHVAAESPARSVMPDPSSLTKEQAAAIGSRLVSMCHSPVTAFALREAVDSHSVLSTMKTRYIWFVPMLEVVLVQAAEHGPLASARQLSTRLSSSVGLLAFARQLSLRLSSSVAPDLAPEEAVAMRRASAPEGAEDGSFDSLVRPISIAGRTKGYTYLPLDACRCVAWYTRCSTREPYAVNCVARQLRPQEAQLKLCQ